MLDLFVTVPPNVTAPVTSLAQSIKLQTEDSEGSESRFSCNSPLFLTRGGVSVEDRSKRTESVRPQPDECCENNVNATVC